MQPWVMDERVMRLNTAPIGCRSKISRASETDSVNLYAKEQKLTPGLRLQLRREFLVRRKPLRA